MSEQEAGPYCAFECPYTEEAHTAAYPDHDWTAPSPALTRAPRCDFDCDACRSTPDTATEWAGDKAEAPLDE